MVGESLARVLCHDARRRGGLANRDCDVVDAPQSVDRVRLRVSRDVEIELLERVQQGAPPALRSGVLAAGQGVVPVAAPEERPGGA